MGRVWAQENPVRRRGGVGLSFGRAQERKEREEEETVARDWAVSEEKRKRETRAGRLTGVCAHGWAGCRKRKFLGREGERKGKLPERVSFLFFF